MRLERNPGPLEDPFLVTVRRHHPDVDLVLLPPDHAAPDRPDPPDSPDPPAVSEPSPAGAAAQERVARVGATVERLWRRVAADPAVTLRARQDALVAGPRVGAVVGRSRLLADVTDDAPVLARLAEALVAEGWRVERADGAVLRLKGERADQRLRAILASSRATLMLEVHSTPLDVGPVTARRLLGAGR